MTKMPRMEKPKWLLLLVEVLNFLARGPKEDLLKDSALAPEHFPHGSYLSRLAPEWLCRLGGSIPSRFRALRRQFGLFSLIPYLLLRVPPWSNCWPREYCLHGWRYTGYLVSDISASGRGILYPLGWKQSKAPPSPALPTNQERKFLLKLFSQTILCCDKFDCTYLYHSSSFRILVGIRFHMSQFSGLVPQIIPCPGSVQLNVS